MKAEKAPSRSESDNTGAPDPTQNWVDVIQNWTPPAALASPDIKVEFAVEGLIPARKVGALVAGGGTGKTILQISMYACGAMGRPFLGLHVQHGTDGLLSNDDSQEDLDQALSRVVATMRLTAHEEEQVRNRVRLHSLKRLKGEKTFAVVQGGTVMPTFMDTDVIKAFRGISDLRILGLDTLRQFAGGTTNDEQVVKLAISGAESIARTLGCAVVIAHHTGKSNYREAVNDMYCGSGSAAIADNCRFVMLLQTATWSEVGAKVKRMGQEQGNPLVLQSTRGSLLVKPAPPIFLCRNEFGMQEIEGRTLSYAESLDARDRAILLSVRAGASTKNSISSEVTGKKSTVLAAIEDLVVRKHITNEGTTGRPKFVLTASGAHYLKNSD